MYNDSKYSGKHMICDFKNIKNTSLLNNKSALEEICRTICMENKLTILKEAEHAFTPQGCTFLFLLSESHLSLHTFPERNYIAFDLYTCREYPDDTVYTSIYQRFTELLNSTGSCQIINREF